jgi:ankyrin repeat protein
MKKQESGRWWACVGLLTVGVCVVVGAVEGGTPVKQGKGGGETSERKTPKPTVDDLLREELLNEGDVAKAMGKMGKGAKGKWVDPVSGLTHLHVAVGKGKVNVVTALINGGADVNQADAYENCTPIFIAARQGDAAMVKLLLDRGAQVNWKNVWQETALFRAAGAGHEGVVDLLLKRGADAKVKDKFGSTALNRAASTGKVALAMKLKGAGVGVVKTGPQSTLHYAAESGSIEMVKYALAEGCRVGEVDQFGHSALHVAAMGGHEPLVRWLLGQGADVNARSQERFTPLHYAGEWRGNVETVQALLEWGASPVAMTLLEHQAHRLNDAHGVLFQCVTALQLAAISGDAETVTLIADQGVNVNTLAMNPLVSGSTAKVATATGFAERMDRWEAAETLRRRGGVNNGYDKVVPNDTDRVHYMDFTRAMNVWRLPLRKKSLETLRGPGTDAERHQKAGPLGDFGWLSWDLNYYKANHHRGPMLFDMHPGASLGSVNQYLDFGVDINRPDGVSGQTMLYRVAQFGDEPMVELYLRRGADVKAGMHGFDSPLNCAAYAGSPVVAERLVALGAPVFAVGRGRTPWLAGDGTGSTALHAAALAGNAEMVKWLIKQKMDVNITARRGMTPIYCARNLETLKLLVEAGADVGARTDKVNVMAYTAGRRSTVLTHYTALHQAAMQGQAEKVAYLLQNGADANEMEAGGWTALGLARYFENADAVKVLMERGATYVSVAPGAEAGQGDMEEQATVGGEGNGEGMRARDLVDQRPMIQAAVAGDTRAMGEMIARGALVDVRSEFRNGKGLFAINEMTSVAWCTPLQLAAYTGNAGMVEYLLGRGAAINAQEAGELTALEIATLRGHWKVADLLRSKGGLPGEKSLDFRFRAALSAGGRGKPDMAAVQGLLEVGANVNGKDVRGWTALMIAADGGDEELVELLLKKSANVDAWNHGCETALFLAAGRGHAKVVDALIKHEADVKFVFYKAAEAGWTPEAVSALHYGARSGNVNVVQSLFEAGVPFNRTQVGQLVLCAAESGNVEMMMYLVKKGMNVKVTNAVTRKGETAMHVAAIHGKAAMCAWLAENGLRVNAIDKRGLTALHYAYVSPETAEVLIGKGADVEAASRPGFGIEMGGGLSLSRATPLHVAAAQGSVGAVKLLLAKGAKVKTLEGGGMTALGIAEKAGKVEVVAVLRERSTAP